MKVDTDGVWVAVKVGGKNHWLFNVMDSQTRFLLAAYLSPTRTTRAVATALALARQRSNNPPRQVKTDGLASYRDAVPRAFPTHPVKPVGSKGIRTQINNNLSERLQGTIRDRDKTLRGPKAPETGQAYVDGLVTHYNPVYFRPHESLTGSGRWKPRARNCRLAVGRMWRRCNPAKGARNGELSNLSLLWRKARLRQSGMDRISSALGYRFLLCRALCRDGGGATGAAPPVDIEILNDANWRIVNWWMTVIDESEEFGRLIDFMLFSRAEFRWAKANMDNPDLTPLRRALAFHVVVEQAVVHSYMISGGGGAENYSRCRVCGKDSGGTYSGDSREVTRCAA